MEYLLNDIIPIHDEVQGVIIRGFVYVLLNESLH